MTPPAPPPAPFRAQTSSGKLARFVPGLFMFRGYQREWLLGDLLAGLSVCVVMIPAVIAYAGLMGLPPQYGLYASLVPLLVYALVGSSRQMIVGPDIAISLLTASAIAPLANGDTSKAVVLAAAMSGISGLLLLLGAWAKLGAVADFLSKPVLVGYMTGAALILMVSQLNKLFGLPLKRTDFFPRLAELTTKLDQIHWPTLALGLGLLAVLIILRQLSPKSPLALIACVLSLGASVAFDLQHHGVKVVGSFPGGLPAFALPSVSWRELQTILPAAVGIALLTYTEGILLARAFAARNNYEIAPDQELVALGSVDIAAAFFQGFGGTGSQARTTINDATGGKTQLVSLVAAGALVLFLLFLTPFLALLPEVALAAILIYAGFNLVEFGAMKRIYRFYPRSAAIAAVTTIGVLVGGVVPGILVGVTLSLLGLINRISNPPDAVLTQVPGNGFHDLGQAGPGQSVPGLIVYRFYAPLLFSNCGHFTNRVRELISASSEPIRWFLLDAQAITDIDVTATEALHALNVELQRRGIALKIAHANRPLRQVLERTGLTSELNPAGFFSSVHECAEAFDRSKPPAH